MIFISLGLPGELFIFLGKTGDGQGIGPKRFVVRMTAVGIAQDIVCMLHLKELAPVVTHVCARVRMRLFRSPSKGRADFGDSRVSTDLKQTVVVAHGAIYARSTATIMTHPDVIG